MLPLVDPEMDDVLVASPNVLANAVFQSSSRKELVLGVAFSWVKELDRPRDNPGRVPKPVGSFPSGGTLAIGGRKGFPDDPMTDRD